MFKDIDKTKTRMFMVGITEINGSMEYYRKDFITVLAGGSLEHTLLVTQAEERVGVPWDDIGEGEEYTTFMDYYESLKDEGLVNEKGWLEEDFTYTEVVRVEKELTHKQAMVIKDIF